jgi:hypothetical protein
MNKTTTKRHWITPLLGIFQFKAAVPLLAGACLLSGAVSALGNSATRTLPANYTPGQPVNVSIAVVNNGFAALEERPPAGWTIAVGTGQPGAGEFNPNTGIITWLFTAPVSTTVTYTATPPAGASGAASFGGVYSVDGGDIPIAGASSLTAAAGNGATDPDPTDPGNGGTDPDPGQPGNGDRPPVTNLAQRTLPASYTPGQPFDVSIAVNNTGFAAIEERPPAGWTVTNMSSGGEFNNGIVTWLFMQPAQTTVTYTVTPSAEAQGAAQFHGVFSLDGTDYSIGGTSSVARAGTDPTDPTDPTGPQPRAISITTNTLDIPAVRVFNLSGNYDYTFTVNGREGEASYTLMHDARGRLSADGGTVTLDGEELSNVRVNGIVRRLGSASDPIHRVYLTLRGMHDDEAVVLDHVLELQGGNQLAGHIRNRMMDTAVGEISASDITIALPEARDGSWTLDIGTQADGNQWGTATLTAGGDEITYNVAAHQGANNRLVLSLRPTEQNSGASPIRVDVDEEDNVLLILGQVKGQTLNISR